MRAGLEQAVPFNQQPGLEVADVALTDDDGEVVADMTVRWNARKEA